MGILRCLIGKHEFKNVEQTTLELDCRVLDGIEKPLLWQHTAKMCAHCEKIIQHECTRLTVTKKDWKEGLSVRGWNKLKAGDRLESGWEEVKTN